MIAKIQQKVIFFRFTVYLRLIYSSFRKADTTFFTSKVNVMVHAAGLLAELYNQAALILYKTEVN